MRTLRALRAIVWLRWRLLKNSLQSTRRDSIEQVSRALALIVPLLIIALTAGTFISVSIVGFVSGSMMADGRLGPAPALLVVRLLVGLMAFTILSLAVISPNQSSLSRYKRLLLLPIHRRVLHLIEVVASLADPWVAVVGAGLTTLGIGVIAGGRPMAGLAALVAGWLTLAVIVCGSSLAGFLVAWLMRDRRRGEMFTLVFVLSISVLSIVPALFSSSLDSEQRPREGRPGQSINVQDLDRRLPVWTHYLPSELHGRTIRMALENDSAATAAGLAALAGQAFLLFVASAAIHRRMLDSLEGDQSRRRKKTVSFGFPRLPLLTPSASAIAWTMMRTAFRTVRGRLTIILPGPLLAILTAGFKNIPDENWARHAGDYGFVLFGVMIFFSFYAMQALTMNMFGSDRAGLTMQLLAPVTNRQLAWGKIAGLAIVLSTGVTLSFIAAVLVSRPGPPAYWVAVLLGGVATFILIAPFAVWMSALFPVASDLSKTGAGGNPHPLPMFAGIFVTAILAAPTVLILALSYFWLKSSLAAAGLATMWLVIACAIGIPLVNLASRTIGYRRENLAIVAQNR